MTAFERGIDCFFKNSSISNRSRNIAKNAQKVKNFTSVRGPPRMAPIEVFCDALPIGHQCLS